MTRSIALSASRSFFARAVAVVMSLALSSFSVPATAQSPHALLEPSPIAPEPASLGHPQARGTFEENLGQADPVAAFVWRGDGHTALIGGDGATFLGGGSVIRLRFLGASTTAAVEGRYALPGRTSYFIGKDPHAWVTGVRNFERVRVASVYRGIDVVWYAAPDGALEYDLHLAPGADPSRVRVGVEGARASPTANGDLVLAAAGTDLRQRRPIAYQLEKGERRVVSAAYEVSTDGSIGLDLGPYDRRLPVVVDPVLEYSTYLGGAFNDWGTAVAAGEDGSTIAVGYTDSLDYPAQAGFGGQYVQDVFVTKLAPDGSMAYSVYIGGGPPESLPNPLGLGCNSPLLLLGLVPSCGVDVGLGVALDAAGNAYVVGHTTSRGFPVVNAVQEAFGGGYNDGFVAKLGPEGDELLYSTYLGGAGDEQLESVDVDAAGRAHVVGTSTSIDFPTANPLQPQLAGTIDAVAAVLSQSGSALEWSTYLGGLAGEWGDGVAVDDSGDTYVVGHTGSDDFPTSNALQPEFGGGEGGGEFSLCPCDGFVAKVTPSGSALAYSTFLGGSRNDKVRDVAVDSDGSVHVIGFSLSTDFPLEEPFQAENRGDADGFITSLAPDGDRLEFSTYLGGFYPDEAAAIDLDRCGNLYAAGYTPSRDFPTHRSFQGYNPGGTKDQNDGYVAKFDPERNLVYSTLLGGHTYDGVWGIAVDPVGTAHVVGFTGSDNFPTVNAAQATFGGNTDAIAARITDEPCDPS